VNRTGLAIPNPALRNSAAPATRARLARSGGLPDVVTHRNDHAAARMEPPRELAKRSSNLAVGQEMRQHVVTRNGYVREGRTFRIPALKRS
jgi:hypothetical protein